KRSVRLELEPIPDRLDLPPALGLRAGGLAFSVERRPPPRTGDALHVVLLAACITETECRAPAHRATPRGPPKATMPGRLSRPPAPRCPGRSDADVDHVGARQSAWRVERSRQLDRRHGPSSARTHR